MFTDADFIDRYKDKYYGKYRGTVEDINDPEELGRVRLKIPELFGVNLDGTTAISGWALPVGGGSMFGGMCRLPRVNDIVWVEFEYGDPDRPLWMHGPWTLIAGNNAPLHARGRYDQSDIIDRGGFDTPDTPNATNLGNTQAWQTAIGQIEFDEDDDNSRILIHHKSGTRIEILNDGTMEINTQGNRRDINRGAYKQHVAGKRKILVDGVSIEEYGNRSVNVGGTYTTNVTGTINTNSKTLVENIGFTEVAPDDPEDDRTIFIGEKQINAGSINESVASVSREKIGDTKLITTGRAFEVTNAGVDTSSGGFSAVKLQNFNNLTGDINIINGPVPVASSIIPSVSSLNTNNNFPTLRAGSINLVNSGSTFTSADSSYISIATTTIDVSSVASTNLSSLLDTNVISGGVTNISSVGMVTISRPVPTNTILPLIKGTFIAELSTAFTVLATEILALGGQGAPVTTTGLAPLIKQIATTIGALSSTVITTSVVAE